MLDIKGLKKIATGGQAEIFDLENGKILRLMFKQEDKFLVDYEFQSLQIVKQNGFFAPEVYDIVTIDNRPGLIMEKIDGITMTRLFQANPLLLLKKVKELGEIHFKLNTVKAPEGLLDLKKRIKILVGKSDIIDPEKKSFVYDILEKLPAGNKLCHGDFHPGNIIVKDSRCYIIDWCGVTCADPLADVAHTYLLFRNVPRIPGSGLISYVFLKSAAFLASKTYYNAYNQKSEIDRVIFSRWLLVRAAERTFFGMNTEKVFLSKFIDKCYHDYLKQRENNLWLRYL